MTVFDDAADVLFTDDNLSVEGLFKEKGKGAGVTVRVLFSNPQRLELFGHTGAIVRDTKARIRLSEAQPVQGRGDTLTIGSVVYRIETAAEDTKGIVTICGLYKI